MEQQIQEKKEAMTTEEKRILRIKQLKAKLQKEQARLSASKRKERDGQLISFGVNFEGKLTPREKCRGKKKA